VPYEYLVRGRDDLVPSAPYIGVVMVLMEGTGVERLVEGGVRPFLEHAAWLNAHLEVTRPEVIPAPQVLRTRTLLRELLR
jgi:hypothetical protein